MFSSKNTSEACYFGAYIINYMRFILPMTPANFRRQIKRKPSSVPLLNDGFTRYDDSVKIRNCVGKSLYSVNSLLFFCPRVDRSSRPNQSDGLLYWLTGGPWIKQAPSPGLEYGSLAGCCALVYHQRSRRSDIVWTIPSSSLRTNKIIS